MIPSTVDLHAVAEGAKKSIVNLNKRMCSCRRFQHYEIPCGHAIAVLQYRKLHEADFCSAFYSLKNFKDAYAIPVSLSRARVHGIYQVIFQILKWCRLVQKDQREDPNLNTERGSLMWNSRGQKAHAVDAIRLDTIGRHVQIILYKNNDFVLLHLCFWGFTLL